MVSTNSRAAGSRTSGGASNAVIMLHLSGAAPRGSSRAGSDPQHRRLDDRPALPDALGGLLDGAGDGGLDRLVLALGPGVELLEGLDRDLGQVVEGLAQRIVLVARHADRPHLGPGGDAALSVE